MIMKNLIKITLTTLMLAGLLSTTNAASITDKCNTGVACYELIDRNAVTAMEGYKIGSAYRAPPKTQTKKITIFNNKKPIKTLLQKHLR